ncbi:MFS transporter [Actinomadura macrotermitis]|uniref:MFS transporter n=1 Tax=Actinomadura macrotermitis TaxID=2585200 RepID=UPI002E25482E
MLLYPVYAVLFADAGLSPAAISSLFVIWSVSSLAFEVPSGLWADVCSRRRLLAAAPLLRGAGFALWTCLPVYPAFAAGFVLWGAGSSLRSGALQALVYEELARIGAAGSYARVMGRARALGTTAVMAASAAAAPVMAAGGYRAVGVASVAVCVAVSVVMGTLPESRGVPSAPADEVEGSGGRGRGAAVWREGRRQVAQVAGVRGALVVLAALTWVSTLDEYLPLLALATGAGAAAVPLLVLVVTAGMTVGGWCAGRGAHRLAGLLGAAAVCLAAGALSGSPAGMVAVAVAVAFGVFQWALAIADARLQDRVQDGARATVTSMAGFGQEAVAVLAYAGYALGSVWAGPGVLFAVAALPYAVLAVALGVFGRGVPGRAARRRR